MNRFLILLSALVSISTQAAVPNCTPGAQLTKERWLRQIKVKFDTAVGASFIEQYGRAGISISSDDIKFDSKFSLIGNFGFYDLQGQATDAEIKTAAGANLFSMQILASGEGVLFDPRPVYDSIGQQIGWNCRQYIHVQLFDELKNVATGFTLKTVNVDFNDSDDQNFPM